MHPIVTNCSGELMQILEKFKHEIASVRANRPTPGLVEHITVDYYGTETPLKQLASIGVIPPREITIQVWDQGAVSAIAKAIEGSSLGLSTQVEGNTIRIHLPSLSEERRGELMKHVRRVAEDHRIMVRHVRDSANKKIAAALEAHAVSEDEKFGLREAVQKATDTTNAGIEAAVVKKEGEIME